MSCPEPRCEAALAQVIAERDEARAERDIYRRALVQIADAQSGTWGKLAHDAIRRAGR